MTLFWGGGGSCFMNDSGFHILSGGYRESMMGELKPELIFLKM